MANAYSCNLAQQVLPRHTFKYSLGLVSTERKSMRYGLLLIEHF